MKNKYRIKDIRQIYLKTQSKNILKRVASFLKKQKYLKLKSVHPVCYLSCQRDQLPSFRLRFCSKMYSSIPFQRFLSRFIEHGGDRNTSKPNICNFAIIFMSLWHSRWWARAAPILHKAFANSNYHEQSIQYVLLKYLEYQPS